MSSFFTLNEVELASWNGDLYEQLPDCHEQLPDCHVQALLLQLSFFFSLLQISKLAVWERVYNICSDLEYKSVLKHTDLLGCYDILSYYLRKHQLVKYFIAILNKCVGESFTLIRLKYTFVNAAWVLSQLNGSPESSGKWSKH